ncbi:MAG TPA: hypothetical protein VFM18_24640 [Methanosarcina sp.]|nr:hypothetical protein [Methanosarcina sp.]
MKKKPTDYSTLWWIAIITIAIVGTIITIETNNQEPYPMLGK